MHVSYQRYNTTCIILLHIVFIFSIYSAFTPPPTSDIISPGLVDDGIKCGNNKMCYEQRCVSLSSLDFPECPTGTNGIVCSGNGVCL